MKKTKGKSKIKYTKLLLRALQKLGNSVPLRLLLSRGDLYEYLKTGELSESIFSRAISTLRYRKYISIKNNFRQDGVIEITPLGKKKLLTYSYDDVSIKKPKYWDGKWRIIIFDISEKKKLARMSVNQKLKELGFVALQKSTFIYPYDCRREIEFIKDYLNIKKELNYVVAEEIDNEVEMEKVFGL